MDIFNLISLLGGLAMFLYGMRLMGDGLKESSSGTLKTAMEKLTNTPIKAFLLGLVLTAIIQSSTATIVITSGLVGAGIMSLHQSLGIIIGANVGTTVTGQIIRLLDLNASGGGFSLLRFFQPSTLAPLALIAGIIMVMGPKFKGSEQVSKIVIGFGILFTGLMNMTGAVDTLAESGIVEQLFSRLGENPLMGYAIGAVVAFVLQSSSASIGILQAFSTSGQLTFGAIYAVLLGIYLGDCVTTAIVINIGAKPEPRRVGMVNILYNLGKSALIFLVVNIVHATGALDGLWSATMRSGGIANTNTIFNLSCAVLLFPLIGVFEKLVTVLVKDEPVEESPYESKLDALNPLFFPTPALALGRCYEVLLEMYQLSRTNVERSFDVVAHYDEKALQVIENDEEIIDSMADQISNYLVALSGHISQPEHTEILNHYYTVVTEFERLGDHAMNIADVSRQLKKRNREFTDYALKELAVLRQPIEEILGYSDDAFRKRDVAAARHIEPLEEVVDDMVNALRDNHLERLRQGVCSITAGTEFLNLLSDVERISDVCSNIGVATIVRAKPELKHRSHDYISMLHAGGSEEFNQEYRKAHEKYFTMMNEAH
jgi:phosphate:Na+ symporter